ncbi:MAG TPA: hypothetical protein VLA98_03130 [Solirubrobacteraceae bacterium]|nr:hypothetical protein [Solirubrobacteraceae bacterium]
MPRHPDSPRRPAEPSPGAAELLRRLSLNDERVVRGVLVGASAGAPALDGKTDALVRLAGLLASGAPTASCRVAVDVARAARASDDEIVGVLVAIAPALGAARLVAVVPRLALAIDCDIEEGEE